ncbi:TRAP transporter substrate-binding protein [Marinomonas mediterranea]|jgi:TRAP-type C4-dicarboxylate transport system, periplasmic component|uniref:Extracellular solute-binding protein, family 7 n=1 Tax=Marinomonas mediterranea (strain ATCC 700492 / JCM 21426 / NBRC 103028 / MMB-1) TaxID=717774 RepID=F2JVD7_MARM1|nr:TRAP transporter substrate-binding protein [Marinomonas mediterranea]ADZ89395.1 Extracellular solute-binding protein, family 7 [Marinomonas mediterranea MMB-1]WCN07493.1 C4-dicarboxylate ABC transporter substrate-binding protein [Marinomonas mediterranea]WCN11591.1 C4-dicarboxylate ABC transporter substrate-binding protein [Marinomonas mediterranea]WCN15656.1 C4-dicarboxylate ABC transporter substrate-binding protein [Marinomonas mediterranea MMB-1]
MKKLTSALLISGLASTAAIADKWHMPTPYGDGNLPTQIAYGFAEEIKEKTNGDLDITVHSGGSLVKHTEIPRAVKTGQVQAGEIFLGILGNEHPVYKHDNIPFLATTFEDAKKLWEAAKPSVDKQLNKSGMKLLYAVAWPAQSLYTKRPVTQLSDLEGAKMRAYSPSTSRLADLMGTTPTTIQVPDIPQAFSTGIIQAMITSPSTGVDSQAWDYVTNYTEVSAWIPKNIVVVNKRAFRRLDKETQQAVLDAAKHAEEMGWAKVAERAANDRAKLIENGMNVQAPSETLVKELQAIGDTMITEWKAEDPKEVGAILDRYNP